MKKNDALGIDVSKLTLDVYVKLSGSYAKFSNDKKGFKELLKWAALHVKSSLNETLICFETTGFYSLSLASFLSDSQFDYVMEDPLQIKRSMGLVRGKDDKVDAQRIANYAYLRRNQLKNSILPSKSLLRMQRLLSLRERLVSDKAGYVTSLKEYKRILVQKEELELFQVFKSLINKLERQIVKIETSIKELIEEEEEMKSKYALITSVKGIGFVVGAHILVTTHCFTKFTDSRKYACYCGTAPFPYQSGSSLNGRSRVNHMANKRMKSLFNLAARSAILCDPELKGYYRKRLESGKNGMSTINIIRNKLIYRVFAVVKRGTPYVELTHQGI